MIIVSIGIVIALCDRVSSGFFKPFFERFRPSRDPEISNLVHIINDYRGGKYGFLSSHAANSFGLAVFISYIFQKKWISISLISWAVIVSYSRIYLGVHYLGDVICGAILGTLLAFLVYKLYIYFRKKYILNIE
jgi:undecaprenyl-diphosphatase